MEASKITISDEQTEQLKRLRKQVAAALKRCQADDNKRNQMVREIAELEEEIPVLEQSVDLDDEKAVADLAAKKTRLDALRVRLPDDEVPQSDLVETLREAVDALQRLVKKHLLAHRDAEKGRIADLLEPYHNDRHRAEQAASQTDYLQSLQCYLVINHVNPYDAPQVTAAMKLLATTDAVIERQPGWTFVPAKPRPVKSSDPRGN